MNVTELRDFIERKNASIDRTLKQYGTGVRPGWVSCDLAILQADRDEAQRQLDQAIMREIIHES